MEQILNISAYLFTDLGDPSALRQSLHDRALAHELKGTVLLAREGINLFLAGRQSGVRAWLDETRADPRLAPLQPKESWSQTTPFRHLRVKVKSEIIRMNHPAIRPALGRAPALPPQTVKRWLDQGHDDQGRAVVTLDTRNAFEVDHGGFEGAIDWRLSKFSDFPAAAEQHLASLRDKTVISYCTGGIRCEKAAIFLQELGLDSVYQIEGGILKYFEEVGDAHYRGACFVFDEREALGSDLQPASGPADPQSQARANLAAT
ncbi:MAG: hypothetical protein RIT26_963 [Pseudomonadota bacterium]